MAIAAKGAAFRLNHECPADEGVVFAGITAMVGVVMLLLSTQLACRTHVHLENNDH